jgi:hypothetical protein
MSSTVVRGSIPPHFEPNEQPISCTTVAAYQSSMAPSGAMATKPKVQRRDGRANAAHNEAGPQIRLERDARVFSICYEEPVIAVEDDRGDPRCRAESDTMHNQLPYEVVLWVHGECHQSPMLTAVSSSMSGPSCRQSTQPQLYYRARRNPWREVRAYRTYRQRRSATSAHKASTNPNGHAP